MSFKTTFLRLVFALLSIGLWGTSVYAGTPTEDYLRSPQSLYQFPAYVDPYTELVQAAERLDLGEGIPLAMRDLTYLGLGDIYHWLGHLDEERNNFTEALFWAERSLECYRQTKYTQSPHLSVPNVAEHAQMHASMIRKGSSLNQYRQDTRIANPEHLPPSYHAMASVLACQLGPNGASRISLVRSCGSWLLAVKPSFRDILGLLFGWKR